MKPIDLHCENQSNPIGIDRPNPRFSWRSVSDCAGVGQTSYQIEVPGMWDSGKVYSSDSLQVPYSGKPLASGDRYTWRVRFWDQHDRVSLWSEWACWSMGFLDPGEWQAKWIASPGNRIEASRPVLQHAKWIWPGPGDKEPLPAPLGGCTISREFDLPSPAQRARVYLAADSHAALHMNDTLIAQTEHWQRGMEVDCSDALAAGTNVLRITATNEGDCAKVAGVICGLEITCSDGSKLQVVTDKTWVGEVIGDQQISRVWELAPWGEGPWGHHVYFDSNRHIAQPVFAKAFILDRLPREAVVHVSGAGQFQLLLNGTQVGDAVMDPPWSVYERTRYYRSFDIAPFLTEGKNQWCLIMGKGFYNSIGDRIVHHTHRWGEVMAILEAHLDFADGSREVLCTDSSWEAGHGPLIHDTMLAGCDYDARHREPQEWHGVMETTTSAVLRQAESPPMKCWDELAPVKPVEEPDPGIFVYDFGQNLSAVPRLSVRGSAGQRVRLMPAEQRKGQSDRANNGNGVVDQAGVGSPNYYDYTLAGESPEQWEPSCTYSGFQYLQLEGAVPAGHANPKGLPVVEELQAVHLRSSAAQVGAFSCSNPLWNKIDEVIDRAVRSNLAHVLTDCPTREKLGWLEVPYLMGPSISRRYDLSRLYAKVTRDIRDTQGADGAIYTTAPRYAYFDPSHRIGYTLEWGAAGVVLPWQLYRWYGDTRVLAENYQAMKAFIGYIKETSDGLVPKPGLGDWFDYGHGQPRGASRFTPPELTAMATFYRCADLCARTAVVLGDDDHAAAARALADQIREGFNRSFYRGEGVYKNQGSPQTANAMALALGLCPAEKEQAVLEVLLDDLKKRQFQQTSGDIGFHYLVDVLGRYGCHEVISAMLNRGDEGSYGFSVERGWTALPEAWEAATKESMNHCMLGHIQQWFSHELIGIKQAKNSVAFKHVVIAPAFPSGLEWASGHYDSIRGRIVSRWRRQGEGVILTLEIPANAQVSVKVPVKNAQEIQVNQIPLTDSKELRLQEERDGVAVLAGGPGTYEISWGNRVMTKAGPASRMPFSPRITR